MDMSMSFSSWSSYETTIIWAGWVVTTRWQFALSCLAVLLAAVGFHALRYRIYLLESYMAKGEGGGESVVYNELLTEAATHGNCCDLPEKEEGLGLGLEERRAPQGLTSTSEAVQAVGNRQLWLRGIHAVAAGSNYGLALFLMLVAMTYNPSLFLMLVVGYSIGDFFFFHKMESHIPATECH